MGKLSIQAEQVIMISAGASGIGRVIAETLLAHDCHVRVCDIDVDFGANLPEVLNLIRTGGIIATYSSTQVPEPMLLFLKMMFMDLTMRLVIVYAMPEAAKQQAVSDIDKRLRDDQLQHRVSHVLPLDNIARAHEIIEQGDCRGCVVIRLDAP